MLRSLISRSIPGPWQTTSNFIVGAASCMLRNWRIRSLVHQRVAADELHHDAVLARLVGGGRPCAWDVRALPNEQCEKEDELLHGLLMVQRSLLWIR